MEGKYVVLCPEGRKIYCETYDEAVLVVGKLTINIGSRYRIVKEDDTPSNITRDELGLSLRWRDN